MCNNTIESGPTPNLVLPHDLCCDPFLEPCRVVTRYFVVAFRFIPSTKASEGAEYGDSAAQCTSQGLEVCTQDQLGAAWFLGYENGCRGWVRDEFGKGIESFRDTAFAERADRIGERITAQPWGQGLHEANPKFSDRFGLRIRSSLGKK